MIRIFLVSHRAHRERREGLMAARHKGCEKGVFVGLMIVNCTTARTLALSHFMRPLQNAPLSHNLCVAYRF